MNLAIIAVLAFGVFNLVGGVIGFLKAGSKASLIAGSLAGLVLLLCAYGMTKGNRVAPVVSLIVALLLGGRFFGTWMKNRRVMPDLLMVLFSAATVILVGLQLWRG